MRRLVVPVVITLLILVTLFTVLPTAHAQDPDANAPTAPEGSGLFEDVSCIQPDVEQNVCYINVRELNVPASVFSLTLEALSPPSNDQRVLGSYEASTADTNINIPHTMHGMGFKVACGEAMPPGNPMGTRYQLGVRRGSSGNFDQVTCPAFVPGVPTAIGANSFTATLDRLAPYQGYLVALVVGVGLLVNLLVPARLRQWRKRTE
jgi:hypothetical protein